MSSDELLDLVNDKDEVIGTVLRSVAHNDPSKIYRVVSVSVFNKKGETLIQKRAYGKSHPGKWENSASGHVPAGEDPQVTAKRELFEELGIKGNPVYYDKWFLTSETKTKFMWIYYLVVDDKTKITINRDEVEEVKWIKPENIVKFAKNNYWDVNGFSHREIMELKDHLRI